MQAGAGGRGGSRRVQVGAGRCRRVQGGPGRCRREALLRARLHGLGWAVGPSPGSCNPDRSARPAPQGSEQLFTQRTCPVKVMRTPVKVIEERGVRVTRGSVASAARALDFSGRSATPWPRRPCRPPTWPPSARLRVCRTQGRATGRAGQGHLLLQGCPWSWDLTAPPSPLSRLQRGDDTPELAVGLGVAIAPDQGQTSV